MTCWTTCSARKFPRSTETSSRLWLEYKRRTLSPQLKIKQELATQQNKIRIKTRSPTSASTRTRNHSRASSTQTRSLSRASLIKTRNLSKVSSTQTRNLSRASSTQIRNLSRASSTKTTLRAQTPSSRRRWSKLRTLINTADRSSFASMIQLTVGSSTLWLALTVYHTQRTTNSIWYLRQWFHRLTLTSKSRSNPCSVPTYSLTLTLQNQTRHVRYSRNLPTSSILATSWSCMTILLWYSTSSASMLRLKNWQTLGLPSSHLSTNWKIELTLSAVSIRCQSSVAHFRLNSWKRWSSRFRRM